MQGQRILIVDDHQPTVDRIKEYLQSKQYNVLSAANGREALDVLKETLPDLIILDVIMPEMNGFELCEKLRSDVRTKNIPILMLTCKDNVKDEIQGLERGADDYLLKTTGQSKLEAHIRAILRRFGRRPYEPVEESLLHIYCRPLSQIYIQCAGNINTVDMSVNALDVKTANLARLVDRLDHDKHDWRFRAQEIGEQFFDRLIDAHSEIRKVYYMATTAVPIKSDLHIKIVSTREFLRAPVEFLFWDSDYLCLQFPLVRTVEGVVIKKDHISPSFFNNLHSDKIPLKVLLIAANTHPPIDGVDREIKELRQSMATEFDSKGLPVEIEVIKSHEATYENVRNKLYRSPYHVVHYSGHACYNADSAEESALLLWEDDARIGIKPLSASELKVLVQESEIRFFYLSSCLGATTADEQQLLDDDFLGIADALIQAGIPSVLGFRWPVSDQGAVQLAMRFYEMLARDGRLDVSLLEARQFINRDDLTWLSPVLISQK